MLGDNPRKAVDDGQYETAADMIRVIALIGCRRSEIIALRFAEDDVEGVVCVCLPVSRLSLDQPEGRRRSLHKRTL